MGFVSFAGRVLFASIFLLSAYQEFNEFGTNGGPAAKALKPKFNLFSKRLATTFNVPVPPIDITRVVKMTIALKGIGGILFIFSSSLGAYLLALYLAFITPIVYDFYNYNIERPEFGQLFIKFTQNLALFGALLFYLDSNRSPEDPSVERRRKKKSSKSKTT